MIRFKCSSKTKWAILLCSDVSTDLYELCYYDRSKIVTVETNIFSLAKVWAKSSPAFLLTTKNGTILGSRNINMLLACKE